MHTEIRGEGSTLCSNRSFFSRRCNFHTILNFLNLIHKFPRPAVFFSSSCPRPAAGHRAAAILGPGLAVFAHKGLAVAQGRCWPGCPFSSPCPHSKSRSISISAKVLIALAQDWIHFRPLGISTAYLTN